MPRIDLQLGDDMTALLEHQRSQPHISFAAHLAALEESLANEVLQKVRIYLDLRYWIFLRDANLDSPQRAVHRELLAALVAGVESGRIVCPITESVFFELDRQGNTDRRMQTVRMIDRLSKGVVIKNSLDRFQCELNHLLEGVISRKKLPEHPCRTVWVKPYSFLGTPTISGWGEAEDTAINKAFLSYMWTRSLEDLLTDTPVPEDDCDQESRETARRITESSAKHASAMRSFPQVFDEEISGLIQDHRKDIIDAVARHIATVVPSTANHDIRDGSEAAQSCLNLIYSIATAKKSNSALPLIRILAGLHSYIRWLRRRPFEFEDFFDIRHAAAAIPYCDVFFTEKFLRTACTSPLLDFGRVFATQIISDEDEALRVVLQLTS